MVRWLILSFGWLVMAFMNSWNDIPPAYSISYSAMISQMVSLLGEKPFQLSNSFRSEGSNTPVLVESQQSKIYLSSFTSSLVISAVTQVLGSNSLRSFLLKRISKLELFSMISSLPCMLQAKWPGLQDFLPGDFLVSLAPLKEDVTSLLSVGFIIRYICDNFYPF